MRLISLSYLLLLLTACANTLPGPGKEHVLPEKEVPLQQGSDRDNETLLPEAYVNYITDPAHGLAVTKTLGHLDFSVLYKPNPFEALSILRFDSLTRQSLKRELEALKDLQYYTFKISVENFNGEILKYNLKSMEEYEQRVDYFSFRMQQDLHLIEGGDTLPCALFHFERNYGVAPNATFILGFPASQHPQLVYNKTLSFVDRVFGAGPVNIIINKEDLIRIPELTLSL